MSQKALYKPTNSLTVILSRHEGYCEIFLNGEVMSVSENDLELMDDSIANMTLKELEQSVFTHIVQKPLSGILYTQDAGRFIPEPHQFKPLIKFLNSDNNRILIADEVGLGKTIEAGMIYQEVQSREELPISVIVVPSSLTYKWREEMHLRFGLNFEIVDTKGFIRLIEEYTHFHNSKSFSKQVIISYPALRSDRVIEALRNNPLFEISFLIMDEAHSMRNSGTSTSDAGEMLSSVASNIVFLSATPVQNKLEDLFNILSMLDPDSFMDYGYFERSLSPNRFIHILIQKIRNNETLDAIKAYIDINEADLDAGIDLQKVLHDIKSMQHITHEEKVLVIDLLSQCDRLHFIVNRTKKKDVGKIIPRTAQSKTVILTDEERAYYRSIIEFIKYLNPGVPPGFITIMPERMASSSMIASLESFIEMRKNRKLFIKDVDDLEDYYEESSFDIKDKALEFLDEVIAKGKLIGEKDSKFNDFIKILDDLKKEKIKQAIVFSFFKKTLDYLERKLIELGYTVGKIDGRMKSDERFNTIKAFKRGEFDILLSSEVGSEGLDMQFCNVVINYDLPWNPMRVEQRIGRIDRIGQKAQKLLIFNLCIEDSIEARIFNRLYEKLNIFESSIGELEPILGAFSKTIDIPSLVFLNSEELENKLHLEELAIKRKEVELKSNSLEMDKFLNQEDLLVSMEEFMATHKVDYLKTQIKRCIVEFMENHSISVVETNGNIKLTQEKSRKLFELLKSKIIDKKEAFNQYNYEKLALASLQKEVKFVFDKQEDEDLMTQHLFINHPIITMIKRGSEAKKVISSCASYNAIQGYAIIYRIDVASNKTASQLNVLLLGNDFKKLGDVDYFEFIAQAQECPKIESEENFEKVLQVSKTLLSRELEEKIAKEKTIHEKKIDIKIDTIKHYFEKKAQSAQRLKERVSQEDVLRMRNAEIQKYFDQKKQKIDELESKKNVTGSFKVLAAVRLKDE